MVSINYMTDKDFMTAALALADISAGEGEIPVGAVVVKDGEIIAAGRNRREKGKNALLHAEIEAINHACTALGGWRLHQCEMYVTLEPCPMCAGAVINARIKRLVFGAFDPKAGSAGSVVNLFDLPYNHKPELVGGFMAEACGEKLTAFFRQLRMRRKKDEKTED